MTGKRLFDRALVRISPQDSSEDVREFLQGLVTNDTKGALPAYAALLSPQGKTLFDFLIWDDGVDLLLDCEAQFAAELAKRLSLYRLRRKISIAVDPALGVFWSMEGEEGQPDPRLNGLGRRWVAPALESDVPGDTEWAGHRLSLGVAEGRAELSDILWLETNAVELNGVSFTKGCYVGQENTARMNWRQKINRRLVVVPIARSDEKRKKAGYPALGLAVDHLRVEDIEPDFMPSWLVGEA